MLMDNGVRLDELEDVLYQMSHEELLKEALEAMEYVTIYRRAFDAAKDMVKAKSKKKLFISKAGINWLDVPRVVLRYDEEQHQEVRALKKKLKKMAHRLKYIYEEDGGLRHQRDTRTHVLEWCENLVIEENEL